MVLSSAALSGATSIAPAARSYWLGRAPAPRPTSWISPASAVGQRQWLRQAAWPGRQVPLDARRQDIEIGERCFIAAGEIVRRSILSWSVFYRGLVVPADSWTGSLRQTFFRPRT